MLTPEQVNKFRSQYGIGEGVAPVEKKPSFFERAGADIATAGREVEETITDPTKTPLRRGVEATARTFRAVPEVVEEALPEKVRTGIEKVGEKIGVGFKKLTDFFGGTDVAQEFVTKHPEATKFIEEIAGVGAGAGEIAGTVLGVEGAIAPARLITKRTVGDVVSGVKKVTEPITKTGIKIRQEVASSVEPAGIMQRVVRLSKGKQEKFAKQHGESIGQYLVDRNIIGTTQEVSDQLYKRFKTSKSQADRAIAKLSGKFKNTAVGNALKDLVKREESISRIGVPSKDLDRVRELVRKHKGGGLSMTEINEVKRLFEKNVKLDFVKDNLANKVAEANTLDTAIREFQFKKAEALGLKNLPDINKETQKAFQLLDELGGEVAGKLGNNAISLTDWLILAESTGNPQAILALIGKKVFSSEFAQSKLAKLLKGKGEPKVGKPKAEFGEPAKGLKNIGKGN